MVAVADVDVVEGCCGDGWAVAVAAAVEVDEAVGKEEEGGTAGAVVVLVGDVDGVDDDCEAAAAAEPPPGATTALLIPTVAGGAKLRARNFDIKFLRF